MFGKKSKDNSYNSLSSPPKPHHRSISQEKKNMHAGNFVEQIPKGQQERLTCTKKQGQERIDTLGGMEFDEEVTNTHFSENVIS